MTEFINKNTQNLSKVCWNSIVGPLIVLTLFYGYFKHVLHQKDFNIYTFSVLAALKVLHTIPFIKNLKVRGYILYTFVNGVINGKKPHIALQDALIGRNLPDLIFYPFEGNRNNNKFKKSNYASRQNGRQNISTQRWRSRPQYIKCRNCNVQLENNINYIREHNNNYCNPPQN